MGKYAAFIALLFTVVLFGASSQGDVARSTPRPQLPTSSEAPPEPITGTQVAPAVGDETIAKDPFAPHSAGPLGTRAWTYKELPPGERAHVDRNVRASGGADAVHAAFASAVQERAHAAATSSAAHQLGLPDGHLSTLGVVP